MAVIYRITNMANGHYYIGSAESFARREWQHKYDLRRGAHKNPRLQAAWNKYGADMFVFEIVEQVAEDRTAFDIENTYLMKCVGEPDCYNINTDAYVPRLGIPHTEASKAKVSVSRKGKAAGAKHYRYGQTVSEEVRKKIGDAQRGKPKAAGRKVSEEGKAKIRAAAEAGSYSHWKGRKHTNESKQKMSRPIMAITDFGAQIHALSITHMRIATGLKAPTINRALKSGQPLSKGPKKGWVFRYADACIPQTHMV